MDAVTIFITHLYENQYLFGAGKNLVPIMDEKLCKTLLDVFTFDENTIIQLVGGLSIEDKKELLKRAEYEPEIIQSIIEIPVKAWTGDGLLMYLWNQDKEFILLNSSATGNWSVFQAANQKNTYGLNATRVKRWDSLADCIKTLAPIAKTLVPDASTVNLVVHDKDLGINTKHRVFAQDELMESFDGEAQYTAFLNSKKIEVLNVIAFQHSNSTEVKMQLLDNEHLTDVNEEVLKLVKDSAEVKQLAEASQLDSKSVHTLFEKRLLEAYKELNDPKKPEDYIGDAYSS